MIDLERMVVTIKMKKALKPLTTGTHSYRAPPANKIITASPIISAPEPEPEETSPASLSLQKSSVSTSIDGTSVGVGSATIVIHGFSLASSNAGLAPTKDTIFALGSSPQSEENKNTLRGSIHQSNEEVATQSIHGVMGGGNIDVDESAIIDDESSYWEDSAEDSGKPSVDENLSFHRVNSPRVLAVGTSLITAMHQNGCSDAAQSSAPKSTLELRSRTSSPQGPSAISSVEPDDGAPMKSRPGREFSPEGAQPIMTSTNVAPIQAILSPMATREITTKPTDIAVLKEVPYKVCLGTEDKGGDDDFGSKEYYW